MTNKIKQKTGGHKNKRQALKLDTERYKEETCENNTSFN